MDSFELWDHPFKTLTFFWGGRGQNWPDLPKDSCRKLPTKGIGFKIHKNLPTSLMDGPKNLEEKDGQTQLLCYVSLIRACNKVL